MSQKGLTTSRDIVVGRHIFLSSGYQKTFFPSYLRCICDEEMNLVVRCDDSELHQSAIKLHSVFIFQRIVLSTLLQTLLFYVDLKPGSYIKSIEGFSCSSVTMFNFCRQPGFHLLCIRQNAGRLIM